MSQGFKAAVLLLALSVAQVAQAEHSAITLTKEELDALLEASRQRGRAEYVAEHVKSIVARINAELAGAAKEQEVSQPPQPGLPSVPVAPEAPK